MKRKIVFLAPGALVLTAILSTNCGGGGSSPTTSISHPPSISNLQYSPQSVQIHSLGDPNPVINWSFQYSDVDGDITNGYLEILNGDGSKTTSQFPASITGTNGTISGSYNLFSNTTVGTTPFDLYVQDSKNNKSNILSGSFEVTAGPIITKFDIVFTGSPTGGYATVTPYFTGGSGSITASFGLTVSVTNGVPVQFGHPCGPGGGVTLVLTVTAPDGKTASTIGGYSYGPSLCGS